MPLGKKLFTLADIKRIPVSISPDAQAIFDASNHQGRLVPLALSEHFGALGNVAEITIDLAKKVDHIPHTPYLDEEVFVIVAKHTYTSVKEHQWLVNVWDIHVRYPEMHPHANEVCFQARYLAAELVKLYPHKDVK